MIRKNSERSLWTALAYVPFSSSVHSFIFMPAVSLVRVVGPAALGELRIPHSH